MAINIDRLISGSVAALLGVIAPFQNMVLCVITFIAIDFITGILASYNRYKELGKANKWRFESIKAWRTIYKLVFALIAVVLTWIMQEHIIPFWDLKLVNIVTGFICGVEFWSFLENAADISHYKGFLWLKRITKSKFAKADEEIGELLREEEAKENGSNIKKED